MLGSTAINDLKVIAVAVSNQPWCDPDRTGQRQRKTRPGSSSHPGSGTGSHSGWTAAVVYERRWTWKPSV